MEAPPARPAAVAASGALARATGVVAPGGRPVTSPQGVRNLVETSAQGSRRADGSGAAGNGAAVGVKSQKVGRNQPCPCGSGRKFKFCHGATAHLPT